MLFALCLNKNYVLNVKYKLILLTCCILCVLDVTPASFETPVGRSGSPSSSCVSKDVDTGKYPSFYGCVFHLKSSKMNSSNINVVYYSNIIFFLFTERRGNNSEDKELPCLDKFLAKNTSEDNALFEHIMDLAKQKEKVKHSWLYEAEAEFKEVWLNGGPFSVIFVGLPVDHL